MSSNRQAIGFQVIAFVTAGLALAAANQIASLLLEAGAGFSWQARLWWLVLIFSSIGIASLLAAFLVWTAAGRQKIQSLLAWFEQPERQTWLGWLWIIFGAAGYPWLAFNHYPVELGGGDLLGNVFRPLAARWLLFALSSLSVALGIKLARMKTSWPLSLAASAIIVGIAYQLGYWAQGVNAYPFSLGWSEVSRYYYASLFYSENLYGIQVPPSVLHPTRYFLQSFPFLLPDLPLWFHRLWQVLLWLGITGATSWSLQRRLHLPGRLQRWIVVGWIFLFLLVGPVYYHLQVAALLVFLGFNRSKLGQTWLVVLAASLWAGVSRLNWYPVPGMLAATLYFLEVALAPQQGSVRSRLAGWARYLAQPVAWVLVGSALAFTSQAAYIWLSGNQPDQFTSSFTSDLLWDRLLPSSTYPLGVLSGVLVFSLPFFGLIAWVCLRRGLGRQQGLRWLGMGALLLVLFAGGLVVSVKIGGGSNLHNMDAYLTLLLVIAVHLYFGKFAGAENPTGEAAGRPLWLTLALLLFPVLFIISAGGPSRLVDQQMAEQLLQDLRGRVTAELSDGGEVLFISQRQLLMFNLIPDVPLVPEYENVFFMEMVMAGNRDYLEKFYADLAAGRFALIISDIIPRGLQGPERSFSEENNVWVLRASQPMLQHYETVVRYDRLGIEVLAPRP